MTVPGRSLEHVQALPPDDEGCAVFRALCDCGTTTDLHIGLSFSKVAPGAPASGEAAFTCETCHTSHWFTVTTQGGSR